MSKLNNDASVGKFSIEGKFSIKQTIATLYPIVAIILVPAILLLICLFLTLVVFFEPSWTQAETASVVVRNFGLVLAAIFGFGIAIWRLRQTDKQIEIAASDEKRKDREHVASLFQGAIQMLNGEDMTVVPLGLTQLVRVARDHPEDYLESSITLLCGIARNFQQRQDENDEKAKAFPVKDVVQEAIYLERDFQQRNNNFGPLALNGLYLFLCTFENMKVRADFIRNGEFPASRFINCNFSGRFIHRRNARGGHRGGRGFDGSVFCGCDFSNASFINMTMEASQIYHCSLGPNNFRNCDFIDAKICDLFVQQSNQTRFNDLASFIGCNLERMEFLSDAADRIEEIYDGFERPKLRGELNGFTEFSFRGCFITQEIDLPIGFENLPKPMKVTVKNPDLPESKKVLTFSYATEIADADGENMRADE